MTIPTLKISDTPPHPAAKMFAEEATSDGDIYLCYRMDESSPRLAWIEWPDAWYDTVSREFLEHVGFIYREVP